MLAALGVAAGLWCWRPGGEQAGEPIAVVWRVDVNAAGSGEIDLLPRVGPVLADRIVADRHARGPYRVPADLLGVHGVGPKVLAGLEAEVTCGAGGAGVPAVAAR